MEEIIKKMDKELKVISYEYTENVVNIEIERTNTSGVCPCCGKKSDAIHSKYVRKIKDLPIQEEKVILNIITKIFFCKNEECPKKTFAEEFDFIEKCSRMTNRLKNKIIQYTKGISARASKNTVNYVLTDISDDTILRLIKKKK